MGHLRQGRSEPQLVPPVLGHCREALTCKITILWIFPCVWAGSCPCSGSCQSWCFLFPLLELWELQLPRLGLAQPHTSNLAPLSALALPLSGTPCTEIFLSHTQKGKVLPALHNPAQNMVFLNAEGKKNRGGFAVNLFLKGT